MYFGVGYDGSFFGKQSDFTMVSEKRCLLDKGVDALHTVWKNADIKVDSHILEYPGTNVSEYWIQITNISDRDIRIERIDTLNLHIPTDDYKLLYFTSEWGKEFTPVYVPLVDNVVLENRKGRSSATLHPWFLLRASNGHMISATIAWSGNWIIRFNKDDSGYTVTGGLSDWEFYKVIRPSQTVEGVHIITVEAENGDIDDIANQYIQWGRKYWYPSNDISKNVMVEWNDWWPYEDADINEDVFEANVNEASKMDIEVCTLDAGWFGPADASTQWYYVRGDWDMVNTERFPSGIRALSDYAHSKGLKFGLWCEIEALGVDAALRDAHPEFEAQRDGKYIGYICFGNPEVQEWAFRTLDRIINEYNCDWIKLDFNLDPGAGCNRTDHGHGAGDGLYEHYMGYYRVLDRIRTKHPEVILENCSSGGLRIDLGIMKRTHCTYLSDPDTPIHDLQLYWGAMLMLAPNVCLHWPWSQTRVDENGNSPYPPLNLVDINIELYKLDYYVRIGMLGWFGYSHRLPDIPGWIRDRLKYHVSFYKKYVKPFVLNANVYRLTGQAIRDGGGDRWNAFQYIMPDKLSSIVFVFRLPGGLDNRIIKLKGLDVNRVYSIHDVDDEKEIIITGKELMERGIEIIGLREEESRVLNIWAK